MEQDRKIRESYFKKDKDFNEKIRQEMEDEENMLKTYFKDYQQPVAEDPTVMKRQPSQQRAMALKSMLSPFTVFSLFYHEYWNKELSTPEERYVQRQCKEFTKTQVLKGLTFSTALTALVSYRLRMTMGPKEHLISFGVCVSSGLLYGMLSSSQYSLQRFESLGQKYALGHSSVVEIEKYRMDKPGQ